MKTICLKMKEVVKPGVIAISLIKVVINYVLRAFIRVIPYKNLRDANFYFVTLGMQIRPAFSIASLLCLITKKNGHICD